MINMRHAPEGSGGAVRSVVKNGAERVGELLETLASLGKARELEDGRWLAMRADARRVGRYVVAPVRNAIAILGENRLRKRMPTRTRAWDPMRRRCDQGVEKCVAAARLGVAALESVGCAHG
jgi:hypothetical protein